MYTLLMLLAGMLLGHLISVAFTCFVAHVSPVQAYKQTWINIKYAWRNR